MMPLAPGHLLAMAVVLLPFAALGALLAWQRPIRIGAGLMVAVFGVRCLVDRRHPRFLARVRPSQVALWSFLMASVHGAGPMLLAFALGLCMASDTAVALAYAVAIGGATLVATVHTAAMVGAGLDVDGLPLARAARPCARLDRPRPCLGCEPDGRRRRQRGGRRVGLKAL